MLKISIVPLYLVSCIAAAHGSLEYPISRIYNCYKENPENPKSAACKEAVQIGGPQAVYDWNAINQGQANGNHKKVVPNGTLCAGGTKKYKGMNLSRADWVSTSIAPNTKGELEITWNATAPHRTKYFKFYITKEGYDFSKPLAWSDLEDEAFCTINKVDLQNSRYKMTCPFPSGKGKHILYAIWQREDSPEAFYACSDVELLEQQTTAWHFLSNFYANYAVKEGSLLTFRLYKDGGESERHTLKLKAGQTDINSWPRILASLINSSSRTVGMGQLDNNGRLIPAKKGYANTIYVKSESPSKYSYSIDIEDPDLDL